MHIHTCCAGIPSVARLARGEALVVELHRPGPIDDRPHARPAHRLVEVPRVRHVRAPPPLERQRRVGAHQHRHARRAVHEGVLGRRVGDVGAHAHGPPAVPRLAPDPVGAREQRRRAAVARLVRVDALDVGAARREEGHQVALDRLAPVEQRLGAHLCVWVACACAVHTHRLWATQAQAVRSACCRRLRSVRAAIAHEQRGAHLQHADVFPAHAAPLDQPPHRRERHGHHVLVLVARRPLAHHQALGVLAGLAVRRLELRGVDGVPVDRKQRVQFERRSRGLPAEAASQPRPTAWCSWARGVGGCGTVAIEVPVSTSLACRGM